MNNDKVKNHIRLVNITSALSLLTLVLFITALGLLLSGGVEQAKVVNMVGIIGGMVLCGTSFSLYSEHPNTENLLDVV